MNQPATPGIPAVAENRPVLEQVRDRFSGLSHRFSLLPHKQKIWLLSATALMLLCGVSLCWIAAKPSWRVLYAGLDPQDARELASELTVANIPFDVSPDGTALKVPAQALDKARLTTAAKGTPKSGRLGFELFDKPNWVGSEFDEKVNFQRALEGELEHTISSLGSVQSARVHLVLPHESLYSEQQREAKASVVLKLRRTSLSAGEADAIRNLIASAVDGLSPGNVVLVDADGRVLLGQRTADAAQADHEQVLADRLLATLEPIAGAGNVRASVNVEYDSSSADEVDESYDPNATVTLSMQRSEQQSGGQAVSAGVPGTQSNAPNAQPPLFPTKAADTQSLKEESGTYGASKKVRHVVQGPGKIRRISAAVLINDRILPGSGHKGLPAHTSWNADQLKHITELSQAAIGFDASRGDVVSVENIIFEDSEKTESWDLERFTRAFPMAEALRYGTVLFGILALIFFVARPAMKSLETPVALVPASSTVNLIVADEIAKPEATSAMLPEHSAHSEDLFQKVRVLADRDAAQSARLVHSWIDLN